jgi:hypothetical protein
VVEFKYEPTGDAANGRPIARPALPVRLLDAAGGRVAQAYALIDSGADSTTFSAEWAALLGISLEDHCEPVRALAAVEGGDEGKFFYYAYTDGLTVEVAGEELFLPVVLFCKGLPFAVLGRRDFFDRYLVTFDQRNLRFFLERLPDPEEDHGELGRLPDPEGDDDDDPDALGAVLAIG